MRVALRRRQARLEKALRQIEAILGVLTIRPLESDVERVYASIRVTLERKRTPIGAHDMLIAAHARAIGAVCVAADIENSNVRPAAGSGRRDDFGHAVAIRSAAAMRTPPANARVVGEETRDFGSEPSMWLKARTCGPPVPARPR